MSRTPEEVFAIVREKQKLIREGKLQPTGQLRREITWRHDAAALHAAGWPLALTLNHYGEQLETKGNTIREPAEILKLHAICEACPEYDGRKCRLCRAGCAGKEKEYLVAIATVGGKCLSKDKPLF